MTGEIEISETLRGRVESFAKDMLLLVKTVSIYPTGHPQMANMADQVVDWVSEEEEPLSIGITSNELIIYGEFFGGKDSRAEVLARLLHARQLSRLTLSPQLKESHLYSFANVIADRELVGNALVESFEAEDISTITLEPLDLGELHQHLSTDGVSSEEDDAFRRSQQIWLWLQGESGSPKDMARVLSSEEFWNAVLVGDNKEEQVRNLAQVMERMGSMIDRAIRLVPDERRTEVLEHLARVGESLEASDLARLVDVFVSDASGTGETISALMEKVEGEKVADLMAHLVSLGGDKTGRMAAFTKAFLPPDAMISMASMASHNKLDAAASGHPREVWEWIESFLFNYDENLYMGEGYKSTLDRMASRMRIEGEKSVSFGMYEDLEPHIDNVYFTLAQIETENGQSLLGDRIVARLEELDGVGVLGFLESIEASCPEALENRDDVFKVLFDKALPDVSDYSAQVRGRLVRFAAHHQNEVIEAAFKLLLTEERMKIRRFVVEMLCHFSPRYAPVLVQRARGSIWYFLRNALIILGRMGDERALPFIISQLDHEKPQVRKEALRALPFMGERGKKALFNFAGDITRVVEERQLAKRVYDRLKI
ncbi:MAG: hypothetical protein C0608_06345 [Deltaproteobacteria bacterium]|nr:MAG: hypothetical protein C0608_06345 [Deltaproteobacteria bacterium]